MIDIKRFNWIKEECEGVLEIYPARCLNTHVLNSTLLQLQKEYKLYRVFNDYIRAIKEV